MAGKRRLVGASGGVFVPHPSIDEVTIKAQIDSGEWSEVAEPQPKRTASKPSPKK